MSVENAEVIEFIGFEESTGKVVLTIADHLPWDDSEHLLLLQGKLNSYLAFIESGEIYESYPRAMGRQLVIDLVLKHSPSVEGLRQVELVKEQLESAGTEFRYRTLRGDDAQQWLAADGAIAFASQVNLFLSWMLIAAPQLKAGVRRFSWNSTQYNLRTNEF